MHYLISVIDGAGVDYSADDTTHDVNPVDAFNDRLQAEGHWVYANGLAAPERATVIDNRGDIPVMTDGPFLESKEYLGGFWIIDAPDLDVAIKLAADGSKACNRKVEVRPTASEAQ